MRFSRHVLCFPVNELDRRDLLVRELQQLRLANQKLQDHVLTKEGEVSVNLRSLGFIHHFTISPVIQEFLCFKVSHG
jgi:hypothetical protein